MANVSDSAHLQRVPHELFHDILLHVLEPLQLHEAVPLCRVCRRFEDHVISFYLRTRRLITFNGTHRGKSGIIPPHVAARLIEYEWDSPDLMPTSFRKAIEHVESRTAALASSFQVPTPSSDLRAVISSILARASRHHLQKRNRLLGFFGYTRICISQSPDRAMFQESVADADAFPQTVLPVSPTGVFQVTAAVTPEPQLVASLDACRLARLDDDILALAVAADYAGLVSHLLAHRPLRRLDGVVLPSALHVAALMGQPQMLKILWQSFEPASGLDESNVSLVEGLAVLAAGNSHPETHKAIITSAEASGLDMTSSFERGVLGIVESGGSSCLAILENLVPRLGETPVECQTLGDTRHHDPCQEATRVIILTDALVAAVKAGASSEVALYLIEQGARIDGEFGPSGRGTDQHFWKSRPALKYALEGCHPAIVRVLVQHGADLRHESLKDWCFTMCLHDDLQLAQALFEALNVDQVSQDSLACNICRVFEQAVTSWKLVVARYLSDRFRHLTWFQEGMDRVLRKAVKTEDEDSVKTLLDHVCMDVGRPSVLSAIRKAEMNGYDDALDVLLACRTGQTGESREHVLTLARAMPDTFDEGDESDEGS